MQPMPRKRTENLIAQQAGAEMLVYDQDIHKACCLNDLAAAVWMACDGAQTVPAIADTASHAIGRPVSQAVVLFTLAELRRNDLLLPEASSLLPVPHTRRQLMLNLGAKAVLTLPVIAVIMAPLPAQAYNGCFDCNMAQPVPDPESTPQTDPEDPGLDPDAPPDDDPYIPASAPPSR